MKIVLLESLSVSKECMKKYTDILEQEGHSFQCYERNDDPEVQIQEIGDADIVMIANMPLSGKVISACPNLKFIDVAFTGVDHVDLQAAKEKGIAVSNASGYSNESVAELVLGMMLSLLRNVPQVEERCRKGMTKDGLVGRELKGKTVGVVGTGAIGTRVANIAQAFGCEVYAYSRTVKDLTGVQYVDLEELLSTCDIISLHVPLNASTKGLISEKEIALMKPNAVLINTSRGPVVDSKALADALNEGKIAGAAVDVFENEPPVAKDHPLLHAKNLIATPHVAFATKEALVKRAIIDFDNVKYWMEGNPVNVMN